MTREPDSHHRHPSLACQALRPLRNLVVGTALDQASDSVLRAPWAACWDPPPTRSPARPPVRSWWCGVR